MSSTCSSFDSTRAPGSLFAVPFPRTMLPASQKVRYRRASYRRPQLTVARNLTGLQNYNTLISMRAKLQGFIVFDYAKQYRESAQQLAKWIGEGKIKRRETKVEGLEKCPEALAGLFEGFNIGKTYVEVKHADVAHL